MFSKIKSASLNTILVLALATLACSFLGGVSADMSQYMLRLAGNGWKDIARNNCDLCHKEKNVPAKEVKCDLAIRCPCGLVDHGNCEEIIKLEGYQCETPNCQGPYRKNCGKDHILICNVAHFGQEQLEPTPQDPPHGDLKIIPMSDPEYADYYS